MKILFLDVDGVLNCANFMARRVKGERFTMIDPMRSLLVHRICEATGCKIVVSSSWRHSPDGLEEIKTAVGAFNVIDKTPRTVLPLAKFERGCEIKEWLDRHDLENEPVKRYAILDDDNDMLTEQLPNFFRTDWEGEGLTQEIADAVITHLNS